MDRFVTKSKRPGASPTKKPEDEEGGLAWPSPPKLVGKKRKSNELAARNEDEKEPTAPAQADKDEREVKKPKKAVVGMRRPAGKHQTAEVTLEKHDNYNQKLTTILAGIELIIFYLYLLIVFFILLNLLALTLVYQFDHNLKISQKLCYYNKHFEL